MTPFDFVLGALAVHRLTSMIVDDTILDRPREWITARSDWLLELVSCPWCVSVWVAAAAAVSYAYAPTGPWRLGAAAAAWSTIASLIATRLEDR